MTDEAVEDWIKTHTAPVKLEPWQKELAEQVLSYTRRVTIQNNAMIAGGRHPATKMGLREPGGETCGSCTHSRRYTNGNGRWWKCELVPVTNGLRTDIRLKWPACTKWEAEE